MKRRIGADHRAELKAARARVRELERQLAASRHEAEGGRALAQLSRELAGTLDLAQATERVLWAVVRLFAVPLSLLFRLDPASGSLVCVAAGGGSSREQWVGWTLAAGTGPARLAVSEGRPTRITLPAWKLEHIGQEGIRSIVTVPLKVGGETIGALALADSGERVFTAEEIGLFSAFADQAALALQYEVHHLESRRRQLLDYIEKHATRVGEELHHEILNTLCGYLATAIDEANYSAAKRSLDALVADLRRIMNNLYPKDLETEGLLWTIQKRLDDTRDAMLHHGSECVVTFDCAPTITDETILQTLRDKSHRILLYRIVLEAIINARKHSKGTSIGIKIRSPQPGVVEISIHDDGVGDGGPFAGNIGMALMAQRAEEIGADLEYSPAYPDGGTVVLIRLKHQDATEAPTAAHVIAAIKSHAQRAPRLDSDHATDSGH